MIVFLACPAALIPDGRQLARCVGQSAADEDTFATVPMVRAPDGCRMSIAAGPVSEAFRDRVMPRPDGSLPDLQEPPWGCDMTAARAAQARLQEIGPKDGAWPALKPDRISVVLGHEGTVVMAALGLTWVDVG